MKAAGNTGPEAQPRRILVACDKFKGSLDAAAACVAIARGMRRRFPEAEILEHPIADGGEGFASALAKALGGQWITTTARDALGRPVQARYLLARTAEDETVGVIEMAEASGQWRIAPAEREILRASTGGTGDLMRHAVEQSGARRLVLGLGGSATNDGGAGMAEALGVRFLDAAGQPLDPWPGGWFGRLAAIDERGLLPLPPVTVACDVDNPLLGPSGASRVFGPQKGADAASLPRLEQALADLVRAADAEDAALLPGAGAAGGLGFGLVRFARGTLVPGFDLIASLTGLERHVLDADLVITGEGSLDAQSLGGKGPVALARLARRHGRPVWAFCGRADAAARGEGPFDRIHALADSGRPPAELMERAAELLEHLAASAA